MCWTHQYGRLTIECMTTSLTAPPVSAPAAIGGNRVAWTAATAVVPAIWGTTYIVTTHLLPDGHPLFAAMMRSLPAGLIALLLARRLPHGSWWWKSMVLGTLNMAAFFPLLFLAAQHLPGGVAATLGAAQPIMVAFLAVAILHERLSLWLPGRLVIPRQHPTHRAYVRATGSRRDEKAPDTASCGCRCSVAGVGLQRSSPQRRGAEREPADGKGHHGHGV